MTEWANCNFRVRGHQFDSQCKHFSVVVWRDKRTEGSHKITGEELLLHWIVLTVSLTLSLNIQQLIIYSQEVGDVALGQILVCGAIFRSKLFLKCTAEEQAQVIQLLVTAGKKKSYLSTVAYLILLDFIKTVSVHFIVYMYICNIWFWFNIQMKLCF